MRPLLAVMRNSLDWPQSHRSYFVKWVIIATVREIVSDVPFLAEGGAFVVNLCRTANTIQDALKIGNTMFVCTDHILPAAKADAEHWSTIAQEAWQRWDATLRRASWWWNTQRMRTEAQELFEAASAQSLRSWQWVRCCITTAATGREVGKAALATELFQEQRAVAAAAAAAVAAAESAAAHAGMTTADATVAAVKSAIIDMPDAIAETIAASGKSLSRGMWEANEAAKKKAAAEPVLTQVRQLTGLAALAAWFCVITIRPFQY